MPPLIVRPLTARRFQLHALGLERPFADLAAALDHLGYVQIDPLNICGRMHDLILRNRVLDYREGDLMRYLHGEEDDAAPPPSRPDKTRSAPVSQPQPPPRMPARSAERRLAFEHHHPETHILAAFPFEAWPHLLGAMRERARRTSAWSGRLTPRERDLTPRLLAEIATRGPLGSEDFNDDRRSHRIVWGAASLVKSTLQKLFFHGQLLIAQRYNNRRRYDLPERVLPAAVLAQSAASPADTARWLALLKLRQRRLATLKREEIRIVEDAVQPVTVYGIDCPMLYCLNEDVPLLRACEEASMAADESRRSPAPSGASPRNTRGPNVRPACSPSAGRAGPVQPIKPPVRLLAPLDPLIYDRRVTAALWDFDYTWEAYTPAAKRVRGHYALPVLVGMEIVGHVEPKANRTAGKLEVASRAIRRGHRTSAAVRELARWLGLR